MSLSYIDDILTDIPDDDLPKLAEMYKPHEKRAPMAYLIIIAGMKSKKKNENKTYQFMSPNNSWKEDGTFFVLMKLTRHDLFFFTLDNRCTNLIEGLTRTKRLHHEHPCLLFGTDYSFHEQVTSALGELGKKYIYDILTEVMYIPKEVALTYEISCPDEVYIKQLDSSNAELVNSLWPHKSPGSISYVSVLIEMNPAYGLFLKSTDELVCWILTGPIGQLSLLQTVEEHKKKGYACVITKFLAKKIAEDGLIPVATIVAINEPSINLFSKKLKFLSSGLCYFSSVKL